MAREIEFTTADFVILKAAIKWKILSFFEKKEIFLPWLNFADANYNHGHNIMRSFDVLPSFPFTTNETKPDY